MPISLENWITDQVFQYPEQSYTSKKPKSILFSIEPLKERAYILTTKPLHYGFQCKTNLFLCLNMKAPGADSRGPTIIYWIVMF
jgi:hypothetical protein